MTLVYPPLLSMYRGAISLRKRVQGARVGALGAVAWVLGADHAARPGEQLT